MQELEQQLKHISITGRMAYCITCLETVIQSECFDKRAFQLLLQRLWDFTSNSDLGEWDERIMPFIPELKAGTKPNNEVEIGALYQLLPLPFLSCIDDIIEVGRGNLYAGIVDYSSCTLQSTMQVVQFMVTNSYPLPPIQPFQRSAFSEENEHGWGKRVNKGFFK